MPQAEVWTRYATHTAPTIDEIEFGVRVADAWNGHQAERHADEYVTRNRRWIADEQTARRRPTHQSVGRYVDLVTS